MKRFLKGHKNDYRDAEIIAEAVKRSTMRFVPLKSSDQLDLQGLHRVRSRLVSQRTAVINQIRGFLRVALPCAKDLRGCGERFLLYSRSLWRASHRSSLHLIKDLIDDWRRLDARIQEDREYRQARREL